MVLASVGGYAYGHQGKSTLGYEAAISEFNQQCTLADGALTPPLERAANAVRSFLSAHGRETAQEYGTSYETVVRRELLQRRNDCRRAVQLALL
jgi:hypothetical protein